MSRMSFALLATVSLVALTSASAVHAQTAPAGGGTTALEEISVEGRAAAARVDGAPGVVTNDGYVAKTTRSATKTDTPVNELPVTVNTVTQKQLQDQQPQNLQEALYYTPGAQVGLYGFDPRYDSFYIRGVDVTYTGVFRDGLRQFNSPNGIMRLEPYGLEAISVLKGPSSAIYGASASVGIIDLVSKRPTEFTFGEVEAQTGSYDRIQGAFDFGGPANEAGTVLYRLTGLARNAGTELGSVNDNRLFFAPSLTLKPSDDTKITFLGEYFDGLTGGSAAYFNDANGVTDTPLSAKDFNDFRQRQGRVGYELEHNFSDMVSLHQNFRFSTVDTRQGYSGRNAETSIDGYTGLIKERFYGVAADTYVLTKFDTGQVNHKLITGLDVSYLTYKSRMAFGVFDDMENISSPHFVTGSPTSKQDQTLVGVYGQDELAWGRWRLTFGGRYDWFESDYHDGAIGRGYGAAQKQDDGKFTGRVGVSYVTPAGFTPFIGYGTSFVPNPGTVIDGSVTKPTVGEQIEAGIKYNVPDHNAFINVSFFSLKQEDGVVFVVEGLQNKQTQLDFHSQGIEIDAGATLANGVNLLANYSYNDVTIDAPDVLEGNRLTSVPKHSFAIWAGYDVQEGPLKGLGLGAGVRYTGQSFSDNNNATAISNDPRTFVDAKISYELENISANLKGISAQLNATNLLDEVKQVCTSNYCYKTDGRRVIASIKYKW
ncbi:TonB-dependent siderophore receptor [Methylopila sp. 73B]|uniref:TonB-dependent siderophore receptor n=1 Tax=Methylopila sp. 73B TaxID=1120792 RepID=UPI00035D57B9|nr:TonB-dependent siderophore receptor [Methylopila sp. 73B]